ncbi:MAG: hypothetical protein IPL48_03245 [Bacteroidetes bacterium]|nr:hypothetical protein [Bacteroidota bacterium]
MKNKKVLAEYILLSACFLAGKKDAFTQVHYFDIDPDIILTDNNFIDLDVNDDGNFDFLFIRSEDDDSTYYGDTYHLSQIKIEPNVINGNEIGGIELQIGWAYSTSFTREFIYAKPAGYPVNVLMSFQGDHNQIIAYREIFSTYIWDHGFWLDFDDERYVCFKLKNADGEYNYGWIRCQMNKEDVTLTIKDYGYEEQINTAILTGSKESYVDIQNTDQQSNLFLTYQNSVLKIEMNANYFQPYLLSVYALNGNIIFQENVVEQSYEKYMDLPVGLHLIKIQQGDKNYFYKIIDLN